MSERNPYPLESAEGKAWNLGFITADLSESSGHDWDDMLGDVIGLWGTDWTPSKDDVLDTLAEHRLLIEGAARAASTREADEAWGALATDLEPWVTHPDVLVARHRPLIEAALRVTPVEEGEPWRTDLVCHCPRRHREWCWDHKHRFEDAIAGTWGDLLCEPHGHETRTPPLREGGEAGLRAAAQAVIDQWTTTFGPDGTWEMPESLRNLRAALSSPLPEDHEHFAGEHEGCDMDVPHSHPLPEDPKPDTASEYGRLLAGRDRLIADGADPAELDMPLPPVPEVGD